MDWADLEWEGKKSGTDDKNIFKYLGGYCAKGDSDETCTHSLMPVSAAIVDIEDLKRNIAKGYFKPDELDAEMLGL
ncbi:MAG: hypothetical protein A3F72_09030 [Bacteroidetes bacterium RIFCSPLOWO2_12_FULL_35_15]|nr:MAG: hypothetical protein A3F72_09030 [Bacteroidetes bacterium RIFCSPLOWO2_12_FULL_35_15]